MAWTKLFDADDTPVERVVALVVHITWALVRLSTQLGIVYVVLRVLWRFLTS